MTIVTAKVAGTTPAVLYLNGRSTSLLFFSLTFILLSPLSINTMIPTAKNEINRPKILETISSMSIPSCSALEEGLKRLENRLITSPEKMIMLMP
jgi:hypothetical protein